MKLSKVFSIVMIAIMLLASVSNVVLADNNILRPDQININSGNTTGIQTLGGKVIGVIRTVGTLVAVAVLVILGVKYMMGSAEEKAEYKKTFIPYIVGTVLVVAAVNISTWVFEWAGSIQ